MHNLIQDYLDAAERGIQEMRRYFRTTDLLRARREGTIPDQGTIEGQTAARFSFHGVGCLLTTDKYTVDFDFDARGECAGFDAWRLWQFAKSRPGRYASLETQDRISQELDRLLGSGQVVQIGGLPSRGMLRLRD